MDGRRWRILLVEDDRLLRRVAEAALAQHGIDVLTAADGEEALRLARSEPLDLILLDLIMPKLGGFEVLRELKADPATDSIRVVVLSNLAQETDVQQALRAGAVAHLVKSNLSPRELAARVKSELTGGRA
jgi:CheY-like chemotaxis protein